MFIQTQTLEDPALMIFTPGEPVLPTGGAKMGEAAADLRFEYAARLRDEIREIERELRELSEAI